MQGDAARRKLPYALAVISLAGITSYIVLRTGDPFTSSICVIAFAVVAMLLTRGTLASPLVVLVPTILYSVGPLYASSLGARLWPFPSVQTYAESAIFMTLSLYLAVIVLVLTGLDSWLQRNVRTSAFAIADLAMEPIVRAFSVISCAVFAAQAWFVVLENGFSVAGRARRGVERLFWMAGDLTGQMIAVVATVLLLASLARSRLPARLVAVGLVVSMWAPFLLGGGRRILLYAAVPAVVVMYVSGGVRLRRLTVWCASFGVLWFVAVPMMFAGGGQFADEGHGEWSMSGAPFVAQFTGILRPEYIGATPWPENMIRALPDALGGNSASVLAARLAEATSLYPTGTSGSPWSDAWQGDYVLSYLSFVAIVCGAIYLSLLLDRFAPGTLVIALGSIALLGRSHAAYMATTIVTPALLLLALAGIAMLSRAASSRSSASDGRIVHAH